jgi:hypothetical protein
LNSEKEPLSLSHVGDGSSQGPGKPKVVASRLKLLTAKIAEEGAESAEKINYG